jgi:hypothetical protein
MNFSAQQWKGLIKIAVVIAAAGVVLAVSGSLRGADRIMRFGTFMACDGFFLFLVARIMFGRCSR